MMIKVAVFYVLCAQVFGQHTVDYVRENELLINKLNQLMDTMVHYGKNIETLETKVAGCKKRLDGYEERLDGEPIAFATYCNIRLSIAICHFK